MVGRIRRGSSDPMLPSPESDIAQRIELQSPPLLRAIQSRPSSADAGDRQGAFQTIRQTYIEMLHGSNPKLSLEELHELSDKELETVEKIHILKPKFSGDLREEIARFETAEATAWSFMLDAQELSPVKMTKEEADAFVFDVTKVILKGGKADLEEFFGKVNEEQAKRPLVVAAWDSPLIMPRMNVMAHEPGETLKNVINTIFDATAIENTQILHENIEASLGEGARLTWHLQPRREGTHFTLFREQHPIHDGKTEIYITHPDTMETRCVAVPLPEGSPEELAQFCHGRESFDARYPDHPQREAFAQFEEKAIQELGRSLADFNGEKAGQFARSRPATQAFLQKPSEETAQAAAKERSIYRMDNGRLSLLPPEVPGFQEIREIEPLEELKRLFPNGGSAGGITIETEQKDAFLEMRVTIGGKTRTTHYPPHLVNTVISSGLFERDLLLAKAEAL